jgi:hypothetical protein
MTGNKNDQHCQPTSNDSIQQSTQQPSKVDQDKMNNKNKVEEIEEWDVVVTDQRRPQFRYNENFGRRNY